ncbi:MAG: Holliday junction branch migration DNA helicase RuvB [Phycisphaerales bacterium]|nr:Holliday junction branch migration DNA helicase RuvB [Phycisphaerales bacterium]
MPPMAKERIVSPEAQPQDDLAAAAGGAGGNPLRPQRIDEYIGQAELLEKLEIALAATRQRDESLEHVLLHGPPGLGKTSLAGVIAAELGTRLHAVSGPNLTRGANLVSTLKKMQPRDVLFIDEIHRLPAAVEEYLYPAMEDFRIDFTVDAGMHPKIITLQVNPFTLIGATTRAGLLSGPLRSRFGLALHFRFYEPEELRRILTRSAALLGMPALEDATLDAMASRSRGTPRVANRLLRRVRDFAQVRHDGRLDAAIVEEALALEGIDVIGLDALDRAYLRTLAETYGGGPAGLEAIAASLGEDSGTLEDVVEPFLLQVGFLVRTRQGRRITDAATTHLGLPSPRHGAVVDPGFLEFDV